MILTQLTFTALEMVDATFSESSPVMKIATVIVSMSEVLHVSHAAHHTVKKIVATRAERKLSRLQVTVTAAEATAESIAVKLDEIEATG